MSPTDLPIACLLDAAGLQVRQRELAALGRRSLISSERAPSGGAVLRFRDDDWTRAELERVVAAESECCPFLDLGLVEGETLELRIEGRADAAPMIADLVGAIAGEPAT